LFVDFVTLLLLLAYRSWYLTGGEAAEPAL
jgi:hypothetical protein